MCEGMVSGDGLTEISSPEQNYGFQQFRLLFFTVKRYDIEINVCINTVIKEEVDEILFSKTQCGTPCWFEKKSNGVVYNHNQMDLICFIHVTLWLMFKSLDRKVVEQNQLVFRYTFISG